MSEVLCPSSPAKDGALLIGVVVGDTVAFVQPAVPITDESLQDAGEHLEQRFRFSLPCLHKLCDNFAEGKCGLIGRFLARQPTHSQPSAEGTAEGSQRFPNCAIRSRCQWFRTAGPRACGVCPYIRHPGSQPSRQGKATHGEDCQSRGKQVEE